MVFGSPLDPGAETLADYEATLSADEKKRMWAFVTPPLRLAWLTARGFLREIVGVYADKAPAELCFSYTEFGKPFLEGTPLQFNLSHSGNFAVVALSLDRRVGVDIELFQADFEFRSLAASFFHPAERNALACQPLGSQAHAFFRLWSAKEALSKAIGLGFSMPPEQVEVQLTESGTFPVASSVDPRMCPGDWKIQSYTPPTGYLGAVAAEGQDWKFRTAEWKR